MAPSTPDLSEADRVALLNLYEYDGAWTPDEARRNVSQLGVMIATGLVTSVPTVIGSLYLMTAAGRRAVLGTVTNAISFQRQIDLCYLRLCQEHMGWLDPTDATTRDLTRYSGKRLIYEVTTPEGQALIAGTLSSGGISSMTIKKYATRLRSPALHDGFMLYLFTPRTTRGQQAASQYASFIKLIHLLPTPVTLDRYGEATRVSVVPPRFEPVDDDPDQFVLDLDGPVITEIAANAHRFGGVLPNSSLAILTLHREARVARFMEHLSTDLVISEQQLSRHYGLRHDDVSGVHFVQTILRPIHGRSGLEIPTRLYLSGRALGRHNDQQLMHLIGTGEMRRIQNVESLAQWTVNTSNAKRLEQPDAIFKSGRGEIAIEYDYGTYALTSIIGKLETFKDRGFTETIWGVPKKSRAAYIERHVPDRLKRPVSLVEWWLPPAFPH